MHATVGNWLKTNVNLSLAVGSAVVLSWIAIAIFAPQLSPMNPNVSVLPYAPMGTHTEAGTLWLGSDHLGRDVLSRLLWGARRVLTVAPVATLLAVCLGTSLGLLAGYKRGVVDETISRLMDLVLSFPVMILYLVIVLRFGASVTTIAAAVAIASAPSIMRLVRGLTIDVSLKPYVKAARLRGESDLRIMFVEILPNIKRPLMAEACLRLGYIIAGIGSLGFLGLGLPPPDPDWGGMISETRQFALVFPHMVAFPALAISSLVLGVNLVADGLLEEEGL